MLDVQPEMEDWRGVKDQNVAKFLGGFQFSQ